MNTNILKIFQAYENYNKRYLKQKRDGNDK